MEIMQGPQPALAPAAPQVAGPAPVQFEQASGGAAAYGQSAELNGIQRKAAAGVAGAGGGLPHAAAIQATGELSRGGSVTMTWTHTSGAVTWDTATTQLQAHDGPVY